MPRGKEAEGSVVLKDPEREAHKKLKWHLWITRLLPLRTFLPEVVPAINLWFYEVKQEATLSVEGDSFYRHSKKGKKERKIDTDSIFLFPATRN